jgi:glycosyltransferase involved in cell wall biosynthesis
MKIAIISIGFGPYRTSGLDVSAERLVLALLAAGHQVHVLAGRRGLQAEVFSHPKLSIERIVLDRTDWIGFGYRAARALAALPDYDVIHFEDVHFAWAFRGKYVASLHHSFHQRLISLGGFRLSGISFWLVRGVYYRLARQLAEIPSIHRAKGLIAVSATTADEFIQIYRIKPERIAVAHNAVDTDHFQPVADTSALRRQFSIGEAEPIILFVGFITPRKGLEYLAQAMPMMHPVPRLLLVGQWRSMVYRQKVMELFGSIQDRIIEVGSAPDELMPGLFSLADVYVSPSLMEGFGIPLAEALACQTPVVATEAGAAAEVVGPGGILVRPRDAVGLANAVSRLLGDSNLRRQMGSLGREHVVQRFSFPVMLAEMLAAYKRFL